ncbi:MAG: HEPN domain-containing protein [Armatimonadetes bacterium]|nr:HEPN domain-containing protein [Armatimonadota bacterium]
MGRRRSGFGMAQRELAAASPVWDGIVFHAQQEAEKYLKAYLEERGILFHKSHDLIALLNLAPGQLPEQDPIRPQLAYLGTLSGRHH